MTLSSHVFLYSYYPFFFFIVLIKTFWCMHLLTICLLYISLECKLLLSINDMRARLPARFTFHLTPIHPFIYCYSSNGTFSFSLQFSYFSHSVLSDSMPPHGLQHARPPCPSPTPGVHSNSCPLRWWCHPTISSSVIPFSSCLQSFPESGSFPMSQCFASGGQKIGVSSSASVLPINIQDWFPLGLTGWVSLQSKGLSRVFSNTTVQKHLFFGAQLSL